MSIANIVASLIPGGTLVKGVISLASGWMKGRQDKQRQEREYKEAQNQRRIEILKDNNDKASDLDMYFVQKHGVTQALSFYVFMAPAVLAFIGFEEQVMRGFKALAQMPDWYMYALGLMLVAIWGFRRLLNVIVQSKMTKFMAEKVPKNVE